MAEPKIELTVRGTEEVKGLIDRIRSGLRDSVWVVGVGVHYAAFVEMGTRYMRAQPYLRPAAQQVMRTEFRQIEQSANSMPEVVERTAKAIEQRAKAMAPIDTGRLRASIQASRVR